MRSVDEPLVILHLSDLQFGERMPSITKIAGMNERCDLLMRSLTQDLTMLKNQFGVMPNALVLSGDVCQTSTPPEYAVATRLVSTIAGRCGIPMSRVFVVPGNHDVSWALSMRVLCVPKPPAEIPRSVHAKLLRRYELWSEAMGVRSPRLDTGYLVCHIPEQNVMVLLLDSTGCESHHSGRHFGFIGEECVRAAAAEMDDADPTRARLRIAVCHHNPRTKPFHNDSLRNGALVLERLGDAGVSVLLHGHIHLSEAFAISRLGKDPVAVCATGRATVSSDDGGRGAWAPRYQVVALDTRGNRDSYVLMRRLECNEERMIWVGDQAAAENVTGVIGFKAWPTKRERPDPLCEPISLALRDITKIGKDGHSTLSASGMQDYIDEFQSVDFPNLYRTADKDIDVVNTYGGSWVRTHLATIRSVIENRRIAFRLCMSDPESEAGKVLAERIGITLAAFRNTVHESIRRLEALGNHCDRLAGTITVYLTSRPILYTAYRVDSTILYAPLPMASDWPRVRIPVLVLRGDRAGRGFGEFIAEDMRRLFIKDVRLVCHVSGNRRSRRHVSAGVDRSRDG